MRSNTPLARVCVVDVVRVQTFVRFRFRLRLKSPVLLSLSLALPASVLLFALIFRWFLASIFLAGFWDMLASWFWIDLHLSP